MLSFNEIIQDLNFKLFLEINAGLTPKPSVVRFAIFAANWLIYIAPTTLLLTWLMSASQTMRSQVIEAGFSSFVSLIAAQVFSLVLFSPNLFTCIGIQLVPHTSGNSFPSDHITFAWSIAFSLLISSTTRIFGFFMIIIGIVISWSRIYVGVHWPLDIVGGILVGTIGAIVVRLYARPVIMLLSKIAETVRDIIVQSIARYIIVRHLDN